MNKESEQPTILQWHREAAAELANGWNWVTGDDIAAIIARHDSQQHAETLRLLEWYGEQARLARLIHSEGDAGRQALANDGGEKARAHLAAHQMKGNQ